MGGLEKVINLSTLPSHSALRQTLNKIAKPFNGTYAGWTGMIQGFQIYFTWNPRLKGVEELYWTAQTIQPDSGQSRLNWLCFLARPFSALQSRISCKIYLESLNHTCLPCNCKDLIIGIWKLIRSRFGALWLSRGSVRTGSPGSCERVDFSDLM